MQISNRTIATLLIATILVYLGGTFISLNRLAEVGYAPITGYATDTGGNVSVGITSTTSVLWVVSFLNWGSGYVSSGCNNCTMQVNSTATAAAGTYGFDSTCCIGTFNWSNQSLLLRNNGNVNVNIQMNVSANITDWFGTGGAGYQGFWFKIVDEFTRRHDQTDLNDTAVACVGNNSANATNGGLGWGPYEGETWTALDAWVAIPKYICGDATGKNFTYVNTKNEANFDFKVTIPQSYTTAATTTKSALIRIVATG